MLVSFSLRRGGGEESNIRPSFRFVQGSLYGSWNVFWIVHHFWISEWSNFAILSMCVGRLFLCFLQFFSLAASERENAGGLTAMITGGQWGEQQICLQRLYPSLSFCRWWPLFLSSKEIVWILEWKSKPTQLIFPCYLLSNSLMK